MSSLWNAKVFNQSDKWVICLYEYVKSGAEDYDDTEWLGKALAPGQRSPAFYDISAVISYDGLKINDSTEWWWLDSGCEVIIKTASGSALKLAKRSWIGQTRKVSHESVEKLGPKINYKKDVDWGARIY